MHLDAFERPSLEGEPGDAPMLESIPVVEGDAKAFALGFEPVIESTDIEGKNGVF